MPPRAAKLAAAENIRRATAKMNTYNAYGEFHDAEREDTLAEDGAEPLITLHDVKATAYRAPAPRCRALLPPEYRDRPLTPRSIEYDYACQALYCLEHPERIIHEGMFLSAADYNTYMYAATYYSAHTVLAREYVWRALRRYLKF
jgi:hypothetical protein